MRLWDIFIDDSFEKEKTEVILFGCYWIHLNPHVLRWIRDLAQHMWIDTNPSTSKQNLNGVIPVRSGHDEKHTLDVFFKSA
jgi:hypothetical protein